MQNEKYVFQEWLSAQLMTAQWDIEPLKGDASFRSYYRVKLQESNQTFICMVAPPTKEKTDSFVNIARAWQSEGLKVPTILNVESHKGFVLLSDFGDTLLADVLSVDTVDSFYRTAMEPLFYLQEASSFNLPFFDEVHIQGELALLPEWFLSGLLGLSITPAIKVLLAKINNDLIQAIVEQPKVRIHRDYHSRNLMVLNAKGELGIIDFQDAMMGPMSYDLVSLLKDCYVDWPCHQVRDWVAYFFKKSHLDTSEISFEQFLLWFDWTGLQRHLKVLGIFSRLNLRDGKPHYLKDIPRILNYVLQVTAHYPEFVEFNHFLKEIVMPRWNTFWGQNLSLERGAA